ncbi:hypothetical protein SO802_034076 [Lithocarpus litseifolius]|uniref:DUF4283 domain-containing protein n=1 Tax=Lithocarpus litseifolius TaxID=425828 RepID=A0AAW2BH31_9ROSI
MEKMMGSWKKLSLSESEGNKFIVQDEVMVKEHLLEAKFLTRRALNMEAITRTFKLLWKTRKGFEIRDMGDHKVLFVLPEASDIDSVLQGEPWTFDRHLVALQRMERSDAIRSLGFNSTNFWVQVHNLLVVSFNLEVAKGIGSIVGSVNMRASEEGDQYRANFIRIRIAVDIIKPLC